MAVVACISIVVPLQGSVLEALVGTAQYTVHRDITQARRASWNPQDLNPKSSTLTHTRHTGSVRKLTVPKSPKLRSTMRSRKSTAVSAEEAKMREALEAVENLKKRRKLGEARLKCEVCEGDADRH